MFGNVVATWSCCREEAAVGKAFVLVTISCTLNDSEDVTEPVGPASRPKGRGPRLGVDPAPGGFTRAGAKQRRGNNVSSSTNTDELAKRHLFTSRYQRHYLKVREIPASGLNTLLFS